MRGFFYRAGPWFIAGMVVVLLAAGIIIATGKPLRCAGESGKPVAVSDEDEQSEAESAAPIQVAFMPLQKGKKVPEIDIPALGKGRIKLSEFLGKAVMLDFWSVGCPPCLQATVHLQKLFEKYGAKGFVVIGINLDPYPHLAKNFVDRAKLTYPIGFATDKVIQDYGGLRTIPQSFLIDQKGNLYRHYDGWGAPYAAQMETDIKYLLKTSN